MSELTWSCYTFYLKAGENYTRDILLFCLDTEGGELCLLLNKISDISRRISDLRHRERSELHDSTHLPLCLMLYWWANVMCFQIQDLPTSSTFWRIARNLVVSASRFLANSECPVWAPLSRSLVLVSAIRVAKTFSRGPVPDMIAEVRVSSASKVPSRGLRQIRLKISSTFHICQGSIAQLGEQ